MQTSKNLNLNYYNELSYLSGLIDSDGCFTCSFGSDNNLKPVIKISSFSNTNTLSKVELILNNLGISNSIDTSLTDTSLQDDDPKERRAPSVRVQGSNNCLKLINKLEEFSQSLVSTDAYQSPFLGSKKRDMDILKLVCENGDLSIGQKIDLKKSLHKKRNSDPDLVAGGIISRATYENKYNLSPNSTIGLADDLIGPIDAAFAAHVNRVTNFSLNNLKVNPNYVVGLFDGDGGFNLSFNQKKKDKIIEFTPEINLTVHSNDTYIFPIVHATLGCSGNYTVANSNTQSSQMKIRRQDSCRLAIKFFEQHPLKGDHKAAGFELIQRTFSLKDRKELAKGNTQTTYSEMVKLIQDTYAWSKNAKGKNRVLTLDEMLTLVDNYYKKSK